VLRLGHSEDTVKLCCCEDRVTLRGCCDPPHRLLARPPLGHVHKVVGVRDADGGTRRTSVPYARMACAFSSAASLGMATKHRHPDAAATRDREMPVLPALPSVMRPPRLRAPEDKACAEPGEGKGLVHWQELGITPHSVSCHSVEKSTGLNCTIQYCTVLCCSVL